MKDIRPRDNIDDDDEHADTQKLQRISATAIRSPATENNKDEAPPALAGIDAPADHGQSDIANGIMEDDAEAIDLFLPIDAFDTAISLQIVRAARDESIAAISTQKLAHMPLTSLETKTQPPELPLPHPAHKPPVPRGMAVLLVLFLLAVVVQATTNGLGQFIGPQGWAFVLSGSQPTSENNLLQNVAKQFHHAASTPGATAQPTQQITPQAYINAIVQHMTLDQKLGQLMIVQFVGPTYGLDISTMISQYNVGAVLVFSANNNIANKAQLKGLIQQMQGNSAIPLVVAIDQEGGTVDRLINLDGPRPSATSIGQTGDPTRAKAEGVQDAKDLSYYGFNLNLAPVVDVTNVYNPQMYLRTFGTNASIVVKMASAYLQGLQQSGKVLGTLKHFPGLGDVSADPHSAVPHLIRSLSQLEAIDWAPYRALIKQGNVNAVMVTHELVTAVDPNIPSSLSYKLVTGILRNQLGFQGVVMTDSLTMEGITAYYTEAQAAAIAIEAGDDLLMGASSPGDVANMINGIKQAMSAGQISQQRIDESVSRILMLKYEMGLIHLPTT